MRSKAEATRVGAGDFFEFWRGLSRNQREWTLALIMSGIATTTAVAAYRAIFDLNTRVSAVDARLSTIEAEVSSFETQFAEIATQAAEIDATVTVLESRVKFPGTPSP